MSDYRERSFASKAFQRLGRRLHPLNTVHCVEPLAAKLCAVRGAPHTIDFAKGA